MDELFIVFVFGSGIVAQFFALLRGNRIGYLELIAVIIMSLVVAFMPTEEGYPLPKRVFFSFCFFTIASAFFFKEQILPRITEGVVLSFTIVFMFILLVYFQQAIDYLPVLILVILATIGTLTFAFTSLKPGYYTRFFLYAWFLIMVVSITVWQVVYSDTFRSVLFSEVKSIDIASAFFGGAVFYYLVAHAFYLFELIPIPGENEGIRDRIRRLKEDIRLFSEKYLDHEIKPSHAMIMIVVQAGLLVINHTLGILPDVLLVNIILIFVAQVIPFGEKEMK